MSEKNYSVIIAEDEYPARELLIEYMIKRPELKLNGIAKKRRRGSRDAVRKQLSPAFP